MYAQMKPKAKGSIGSEPIISKKGYGFLEVRVMMFNATFNNISVIWWWSVLLVEKTRQVTDKLYHILLYQVHIVKSGI